ncbi:MAG: hypothetical protein HXY34_13230 [Candidatus Thorarchaeota archaeon]|nr:hypothetical protein [Candidatus Thorarchaeota archaeon]
MKPESVNQFLRWVIRSMVLDVLVGCTLVSAVILIPKEGMLVTLQGASLNILVHVFVGLFSGAFVAMVCAEMEADLLKFEVGALGSKTETDALESLTRLGIWSSRYIVVFLLGLIVFLTGSFSYAAVWHEVLLGPAIVEYLFHLIRALFVITPSFLLGLTWGILFAQRHARRMLRALSGLSS